MIEARCLVHALKIRGEIDLWRVSVVCRSPAVDFREGKTLWHYLGQIFFDMASSELGTSHTATITYDEELLEEEELSNDRYDVLIPSSFATGGLRCWSGSVTYPSWPSNAYFSGFAIRIYHLPYKDICHRLVQIGNEYGRDFYKISFWKIFQGQVRGTLLGLEEFSKSTILLVNSSIAPGTADPYFFFRTDFEMRLERIVSIIQKNSWSFKVSSDLDEWRTFLRSIY